MGNTTQHKLLPHNSTVERIYVQIGGYSSGHPEGFRDHIERHYTKIYGTDIFDIIEELKLQLEYSQSNKFMIVFNNNIRIVDKNKIVMNMFGNIIKSKNVIVVTKCGDSDGSSYFPYCIKYTKHSNRVLSVANCSTYHNGLINPNDNSNADLYSTSNDMDRVLMKLSHRIHIIWKANPKLTKKELLNNYAKDMLGISMNYKVLL
jgi:hypothetical protein